MIKILFNGIFFFSIGLVIYSLINLFGISESFSVLLFRHLIYIVVSIFGYYIFYNGLNFDSTWLQPVLRRPKISDGDKVFFMMLKKPLGFLVIVLNCSLIIFRLFNTSN